MKHLVTIIISLALFNGLFGQLVTPFTIRYQAQQKGGITFISNSSVTCDGGAGCSAGQSEVPPVGTSSDNTFNAAYIDIDSDTNTYSSSSDSLMLPSCSQITWAGLYWGGENQSEDSSYADRDQVWIKVNDGSYTTLTADYLEDNTAGFSTYHCFKDVTSILQANGLNARYTLGNVAARVGGTNRFGGWTIVVVYQNDLMNMRNLTVFNGLSCVSTTNPTTDIPITGFVTPLSGPVSFELGMIVYDGDRASTGDQLQFNGNGSFVGIFDALNPTNDIFNSTLSNNGVISAFRNPNYANTLGYDADIFYPNNAAFSYIGNSDTTATIRQTTGGETFLTQVVTSAIDIYEPDLRAIVKVLDVNGGTLMPGDTLEYTVTGKNIGSDPSVNTFITDTLEHNVSFVPGSMNVIWGPNPGIKTDVSGDDQGEYSVADHCVKLRVGSGANATNGGIMLNSALGTDSTQFKFRTVVSNDCVALSCDNVADNMAYIHGTGNVSGNTYYNESDPGTLNVLGCFINGPTSLNINSTACTAPSDSSFAACDNMPYTMVYSLPGYTYYNDNFSAVTLTDSVGTFYAIHSAYSGCADTVTINITSITNCDMDNDSLINVFDLDDDNDGVLDSVETTADLDGDGVLNSLDLDSDNDGIPDIIEAGGSSLDSNSDGQIDIIIDANNDGFDDSVAVNALANADADGDGIINSWDLDSDNDGILDVIEANGTDPDTNGFISVGTGAGISDVDNDGLADVVDPDLGSTPLVISNTDSVGGANYIDIDSDGDGIVDNIEAQSSSSYVAPVGIDLDNDGIDDIYDSFLGFGGTGLMVVNTDSTGNPDYCDTDSDDDGDLDAIEGWDTDNNGVANTVAVMLDNDGDGLDNAFDANDAMWNVTNGQVPSSFPNLDNTLTTELDWREIIDYDNDGVTDIADLDNDNDGIPDATEIFIAPIGGDADNDGHPEEMDLDSDNDGIPDIIEAGGTDSNGDGEVDGFVDANNNGFDDNIEANPLPGGNADGDQVWNGTDLDSDNDGISDVREALGSDPDNNGQIGTGTGTSIPDTDDDGFSNVVDTDNGGTALLIPNTDSNGYADYLDIDSDQDGIVDNIEAQATTSFITTNTLDSDTDGITNVYDTFSGFGGTGLTPVNTEGNGLPDYRDIDSDNDGDLDALEGWDADNNDTAEVVVSGNDLDMDGLDDAYDNNDASWDIDNGQTPLSFPNMDDPSTAERDWREETTVAQIDSDNDGIMDGTDIDDDNDGLLDTVENATADNGGDTDNDNTLDVFDLDSDNDGIRDVIEAGGTDPDNDGRIGSGAIVDSDGDGWSNITDPDNGGTPLPNPNTDGDANPNFQDVDSDGDTVSDYEENDPLNTGADLVDTDGDGIPNYMDTDDDEDGRLTTNEADENNDGVWDDCDHDGLPDYLDPDNCGFSIPEGFSPNGDGINDEFVIHGLGIYDGAKLSVFNRWGNLVYQADDYKNDWNGEATEGATLGGTQIPVGTYFYVLEIGDMYQPYSGYIYINR